MNKISINGMQSILLSQNHSKWLSPRGIILYGMGVVLVHCSLLLKKKKIHVNNKTKNLSKSIKL